MGPAYNGEQYEGPEVEEAEDYVPGGQRAGGELELADDPAREDETHGLGRGASRARHARGAPRRDAELDQSEVSTGVT